jgi:membrane protein implicated in regulation of membrane protease activity
LTYTSNRGFPAGNPLANALVIIVGALTITASLVLGFFAFLVLAALLLIFAGIVSIRLWWFRRTLRKSATSSRPSGRADPSRSVIEGEFLVVDESPGEQADARD